MKLRHESLKQIYSITMRGQGMEKKIIPCKQPRNTPSKPDISRCWGYYRFLPTLLTLAIPRNGINIQQIGRTQQPGLMELSVYLFQFTSCLFDFQFCCPGTVVGWCITSPNYLPAGSLSLFSNNPFTPSNNSLIEQIASVLSTPNYGR